MLDDATRETMGRRSDWKGLLAAPLPPPAADAAPLHGNHEAKDQDHEPTQAKRSAARQTRPRRQPGKGARLGAIIVLVLIVASLAGTSFPIA